MPDTDLLQLLTFPDNPKDQERPRKLVTKENLDSESSPMVRALAIRRAAGATLDDLSHEFNLDELQIRPLLTKDWFTRLVLRYQTTVFASPSERLKAIATHALEVKYQLMMHGSDTIKDRASSDLLDRAWGKATQFVETRNLNLNFEADEKKLDEDLEKLETRLLQLEEQREKLQQQTTAKTAE